MQKKEPRCANSKTSEVVVPIFLALALSAPYMELGDE